MPQGLLTRAEAMNYLGCDSSHLNRLIQKKGLNLYKIGGEFERFSKEEVLRIKRKGSIKIKKPTQFKC